MKSDHLKIALVGNPNAGKSSIFNLLTGLRQQVSNFPGVTIEKKTGAFDLPSGKKVAVTDLPGCYSLYPNSSDERIVGEILTNPQHLNFPDLVVYVLDVMNLERHMLLATQIIDLGIPMILAVNMMDLAAAENIQVDIAALQAYLQVPVVPISGRTAEGKDNLLQAIDQFHQSAPPHSAYLRKEAFYALSADEKSLIQSISGWEAGKTDYSKLVSCHLAQDISLAPALQQGIEQSVQSQNFNRLRYQINETMTRFRDMAPSIKRTLDIPSEGYTKWTHRIDQIITHRFIGPLIFFTIMLFVFQAIYAWSEAPMGWIEETFAWMTDGVKSIMPEAWYTDLLTDGVIAGLGGVVVFVPQITILFLLIALLEESGYMSRAVFMFDEIMQKFGMNGRSLVSLISSGACAIPAIMATRTITDWKERIITMMVAPLISCSARIPVYAVLIGFVVPDGNWGIFNYQGLAFMGLYLLGIIASLVAALVFKWVIKSKQNSQLMIELPVYKAPLMKNVLLTVREKVWSFISSAGQVILGISIVLWFLASYGPGDMDAKALAEVSAKPDYATLTEDERDAQIQGAKISYSYAGYLGKAIEPAIAPLGFDWKIGIALITSFAAREVFVGTMATIYSIGSTDDEDESTATLRQKMGAELKTDGVTKRYDFPTALSLLVFYVFAMQCMSTLAVTKKETNGWKWPMIQLGYMTAMAYFGSLLIYQFFS